MPLISIDDEVAKTLAPRHLSKNRTVHRHLPPQNGYNHAQTIAGVERVPSSGLLLGNFVGLAPPPHNSPCRCQHEEGVHSIILYQDGLHNDYRTHHMRAAIRCRHSYLLSCRSC